MNCPFCNFDKTDIVNTIIEESTNFVVLPSKGSLCDGYLLIIPKKHINAINELSINQKKELSLLISKYRHKFYTIYNRFPILFEHGSSNKKTTSSSSVKHAHMHIVNHNFINEEKIINELNLTKVNATDFFTNKNQNYISYISQNFDYYITYNFKPISQQMRIYIADELNLSNNFNWRNHNFEENIIKTINKFKLN